MRPVGSGHHLLGSFALRLFDRQTDEGFWREINVPVLLEQNKRLTGIKVCVVELFFIGGRIGPGDEFDGLDNHGMVFWEKR
jgi:hypothetical protein